MGEDIKIGLITLLPALGLFFFYKYVITPEFHEKYDTWFMKRKQSTSTEE